MTFTLHRFSRLYSLILCVVLLPALSLAAPVQDCPFGQLQLPRDYRSGRTTFQHWIDARTTVTLGEMSGAGCLRHIWMTFNGASDSTELGLHLVLRIYTDGKQHPDVEVPVSAFFCQFHGLKPGPIDSPFLQVTARGGLNSYFPMPYSDGMKITLENPTERSFDIYWQGDHQSYPEGTMNESRRFRAVYRRVNPASAYADPFIIGHGTKRGFLAGASMGMQVFDRSDAWYHNGGDLILLDGRTGSPAVLGGIGGEDFFGNAYGMEAFSNGPIGAPYYIEADDAPKFLDFGQEGDEVDADRADAEPYLVFAAYRFYERDPVVFRSDFSIRFGAYENDIATVLYWYEEGNDPLPFHLPPPANRLPGARVDPGVYDRAPAAVRRWNVCGPFPAETRAEFELPGPAVRGLCRAAPCFLPGLGPPLPHSHLRCVYTPLGRRSGGYRPGHRQTRVHGRPHFAQPGRGCLHLPRGSADERRNTPIAPLGSGTRRHPHGRAHRSGVDRRRIRNVAAAREASPCFHPADHILFARHYRTADGITR